VIYGIIDIETLQLTFAKAGHPEPMLMRADGSHELLVSDGCLLGIFPDFMTPR
jgi:serine phosphatase RsbU (regulator of sigma subunit)